MAMQNKRRMTRRQAILCRMYPMFFAWYHIGFPTVMVTRMKELQYLCDVTTMDLPLAVTISCSLQHFETFIAG